LVPVGVAGLAAILASGIFHTGVAGQNLPRTSPAALLAAVKQTSVTGFSGTLVSHVDLGLPELPSFGAGAGGDEDATLTTLLSGSHTLQVWYGGQDKQRIAVLGATEETDVFRNGRDVWQWTSADHTAVHSKLPAGHLLAPDAAATTLTPAGLAHRAIAAMNPSTRVTVDNQHTVAERSAYELVLTPRSSATKIGAVHIEVDGKTKVPLGVQIYPRQSSHPAIDVAFTSVNFGQQAERNFEFTPPPNAKTVERGASKDTRAPGTELSPPAPKRTGSGWTSVLALRRGKAAAARFGKGPLKQATTAVSGAWGKGRLLDTALVAVLVTNDGRLYVGTVEPATLFAAAAK
jgi:outer membrane lipoprotein-sorting protein